MRAGWFRRSFAAGFAAINRVLFETAFETPERDKG